MFTTLRNQGEPRATSFPLKIERKRVMKLYEKIDFNNKKIPNNSFLNITYIKSSKIFKDVECKVRARLLQIFPTFNLHNFSAVGSDETHS